MQYLVISLLVIMAIVSIPIAYGQVDTKHITVNTPLSTYYEGDVLFIGGHVSNIVTDTPITIQVFAIDNSVIDIAQIEVSLDGSFAHTMIVSGPQWSNAGEYRIEAKYGGNVDTAKFQFVKTQEFKETKSSYEIYDGEVGTFDIKYAIRGAEIESMSVDTYELSMLIFIDASSQGEITVNLPTEFFDAKNSQGSNIKFITLVEDIEVPHVEGDSNERNREITIKFTEDDSEIRIIGTHAIPEFGLVAMLVLAASISAIIVLRLRMPNLKPVF